MLLVDRINTFFKPSSINSLLLIAIHWAVSNRLEAIGVLKLKSFSENDFPRQIWPRYLETLLPLVNGNRIINILAPFFNRQLVKWLIQGLWKCPVYYRIS